MNASAKPFTMIAALFFLLAAGVTGVVIHYDDELGKWINEKANMQAPIRMLDQTRSHRVADRADTAYGSGLRPRARSVASRVRPQMFQRIGLRL